MNLRDFKTVADRRVALEKERDISLSNIGSFTLDEAIASNRNCENMIGVAQVPMGIAGPLKIKDKEYFIPLATTEGALVASINRGCKAIMQSGGALVNSHRVGTTRGPVFKVASLSENQKFYEFLQSHEKELADIAEKTSHHLKFKKQSSSAVGKFRYIRFVFDTQDAMGMNMVTIATEAIVQYIEKETGAYCISVAGNYDVDKKPAWQNFINNRGIKAWAEVTLSSSVLAKTLKTTAKKVYDVWLAKCMIGSAMAGSMGFNAQFANVVAAIFLATGQDMAHVSEGSIGMTTCEIVSPVSFPRRRESMTDGSPIRSGMTEESLYISIYLPDLMVGTVGGGTGLATQKEALSILGVTKSLQLAEVIGAAVLAGEISLLASLSEGTLANAHQKLARGGKR